MAILFLDQLLVSRGNSWIAPEPQPVKTTSQYIIIQDNRCVESRNLIFICVYKIFDSMTGFFIKFYNGPDKGTTTWNR